MNAAIRLFASIGILCAQWQAAGAAERPNIVHLLVDDLGRADCGFMGGKDIRTPHIDKLARAGTILDAFYVQPVFGPVAQGSLCLATLGFAPESLWDSAHEFPKGINF